MSALGFVSAARARSAVPRPAWVATLALVLVSAPAHALAQAEGPSEAAVASAFADEATRHLHATARDAIGRVERDVLSYTALVRQRGGVDLRLPIRDRSLFRMEQASRVFWSRDGDVVVQLLGGRELEPGDREADADRSGGRQAYFNPGASRDRLTFGMLDDADDEEVWFHHPLGRTAEEQYTFRTGSTVTMLLPDGRRLSSIELQVIPREADPRSIAGSLWIEPESGALVRAAYRMAAPVDMQVEVNDDDDVWIPGIFKPMTAEFTLATVEYALWDFRVWLPRSMRIEGIAQAGILKVPAAFEVSYSVESVTLQGDLEREPPAGAPSANPDVREEKHFRTRSEAMAYLAELMAQQEGLAFRARGDQTRRRLNGQTTRVFLPEDPEMLLRSPELPPPIWEDAPGFVGADRVDELLDILEDVPGAEPQGVGWAFNWGNGRPDLMRYNRIEALSIGARGELFVPSPVGPLFTRLQAFMGVADLEPKVRLSVDHESLRRKLSLGLYHELEPVSRQGRYLGIGNSAFALLFGRDEGEYFMATGADLRITPPSAERNSAELRLYAERQSPVETNTSFSLAHAFDGDWQFRPNIVAEEVTEVGASLLLSPWWGEDPLAPQAGVELFAQGATGDVEYARASLALRGVLPLFSKVSVGAEVAAGESWGTPTLQRNWFLGGSSTLRGYDPSTLVGPAFGRARLELVRTYRAVGISLFGDGAWAGERLGDFREQDALFSVGAGFSLLDGIIRFDVARGLRDPKATRFYMYLDGIL